jgi:N-acetylmuramoyl-L-alanine amidase
MKQIGPHRNSPYRVKVIRCDMLTATRVRRRLILRQFAGGGAIFCSLLGNMDRQQAQGARAKAERPPPLVILDPGHGGRDPGATGVAGTLEKDVTLASAFALKASLEAEGRYRVALTRALDHYVAPDDRVDLARDLGASLFLSMHADQLSDPGVRGASVYTLAKLASDAETEALAERENGFVAGGDGRLARMRPEVSDILASLAARETRAASTRIARQLVYDLQRRMPVLPTPERHANFTVLHASGIPSVLVEMGFLSNTDDEASLNDAAHREVIARAMTRAVNAWFAGPRGDGLL